MNNADYWKKRFEAIESRQFASSAETMDKVNRAYVRAQQEVEDKLSKWYVRFAGNNGMTLSEARKALTGRELSEFRWDVGEYIKKAKENQLTEEWARQLENASARFHVTRLEAIQLQMQQSVEKLFGNQLDTLDSHIKKTYLDTYYHTAFEVQKGVGVGWDVAGLDDTALEHVAKRPWTTDGYNFSDRIWKNKASLGAELNTLLTRDLMTGKAPRDTIAEMAKKFSTSRSNAARLVMTESAYVSSCSQRDCFKSLGVEEYVIVSALDTSTCEICGGLDGKHFKQSEFEPAVTAPPFHPRCRCATAPYFADLDGIGDRAARGADGKTYDVPKDMTYREWKEKCVDKSENRDIIKPKNQSEVVLSTYVSSSDDISRYAKNIKPIAGFEDVVIHGNETGFEIRDKNGITAAEYTPREFAEILRSDPNYHGGNIRLISCNTGSEGAIAANALAKQLGINILAPTDVVVIYPDGKLKVGFKGDGKWVMFDGRS